ncbi:MAG: RNA polymerase sigma factor [Kofleriaceae bacterium]
MARSTDCVSAADRAYMFAVVRRIVRCEDAANDATQDAALLAHRHRAKFRGASAFRTWLHRIAVTSALGYLRKRRHSREELATDDVPLAEPADQAPSPEHVAATRELAEQACDLLAGISRDHRDVFLLRAGDCSEHEIAVHLGISRANVKIRGYRARQQLRARLAI